MRRENQDGRGCVWIFPSMHQAGCSHGRNGSALDPQKGDQHDIRNQNIKRALWLAR